MRKAVRKTDITLQLILFRFSYIHFCNLICDTKKVGINTFAIKSINLIYFLKRREHNSQAFTIMIIFLNLYSLHHQSLSFPVYQSLE